MYEALVSTVPGVDRKGAANPYTSRNGWMHSFLDKEGSVSIRLGKDDLESFLEKYVTERSVQYGSVMKDFAVVPDDLLGTDELSDWFARSWDWVGTLKPKPTKK
jgi:hypothetical protein